MTDEKKNPSGRGPASKAPAPSGRVTRDERGNAVWKWKEGREEAQGSVNHLGLSLADDVSTTDTNLGANREAPKMGSNPYQSDAAGKPKSPKRTDLRALSRHIELQRKLKKDGGTD